MDARSGHADSRGAHAIVVAGLRWPHFLCCAQCLTVGDVTTNACGCRGSAGRDTRSHDMQRALLRMPIEATQATPSSGLALHAWSGADMIARPAMSAGGAHSCGGHLVVPLGLCQLARANRSVRELGRGREWMKPSAPPQATRSPLSFHRHALVREKTLRVGWPLLVSGRTNSGR